eukprot:5743053-Pyramimonas_sp.AAC.1
MARQPDNHQQVLMAILGTTELDRQLGRPRITSGGRLTCHSTPWAKQRKHDIAALAGLESSLDVAWQDKERHPQHLHRS